MNKRLLWMVLLACFAIINAGFYIYREACGGLWQRPSNVVDSTEASEIRLNQQDLGKLIDRELAGQFIPFPGHCSIMIENCSVSCQPPLLMVILHLRVVTAGSTYSGQVALALLPYEDGGDLVIRLQDIYWDRFHLTAGHWLAKLWTGLKLPDNVSYRDNTWKIDIERYTSRFELMEAAVQDHSLLLTVAVH